MSYDEFYEIAGRIPAAFDEEVPADVAGWIRALAETVGFVEDPVK